MKAWNFSSTRIMKGINIHDISSIVKNLIPGKLLLEFECKVNGKIDICAAFDLTESTLIGVYRLAL